MVRAIIMVALPAMPDSMEERLVDDDAPIRKPDPDAWPSYAAMRRRSVHSRPTSKRYTTIPPATHGKHAEVPDRTTYRHRRTHFPDIPPPGASGNERVTGSMAHTTMQSCMWNDEFTDGGMPFRRRSGNAPDPLEQPGQARDIRLDRSSHHLISNRLGPGLMAAATVPLPSCRKRIQILIARQLGPLLYLQSFSVPTDLIHGQLGA